ncbi:FH protein interacting protein FIP2-like [Pyrus ussuriensis x Pyrus communis]|uniref:FH protein interacting protein FIP2-like n=1 Tax=Pyrus ussuriensis x Pyrus communis TaxID=2448454 RepID=A0A5N5GMD0_9ROSA|nr:FH protein interacting protein FIP2-like [Pyrus ussuriensis x Pyrus communis]
MNMEKKASSSFIGASLRLGIIQYLLQCCNVQNPVMWTLRVRVQSLKMLCLEGCEFGGANLRDALFVDPLTLTTHI